MFWIFFILWIVALVFLQFRDQKTEEEIFEGETAKIEQSTKSDNIERLVRLYIFLFAIVIIFKVVYFIIQFFGNIYIA